MEAERWGRRIQAFRKLKGKTQVELAKAIGVTLHELGEVERGNRLPTNEMVTRISHGLNVSEAELRPKDRSSNSVYIDEGV